MKKAYFNWSTGKDSALALYTILNQNQFSVDKLITTVNQSFQRVSMHGVPEILLDKQSESIGVPLRKIYIPKDVTMKQYSEIMLRYTRKLVDEGYEYSVFGDIFLDDLKEYRESQLSAVNLKAVFPLWKRDTKEIIKEFISAGFKAVSVCVNAKLLNESFVGREINEEFINDLPENVDVCGENGEFHTFVYDGPIFSNPIKFKLGEKVLKSYKTDDKNTWDSGFWYCDLLTV